MGNEVASYRLVYFQPDPEDGERVCVALLFNTQRDVELLYDRAFPRLGCLAPHIDRDLVRMYLEDMESNFKNDPMNVESLVRRRAPSLVMSEPRKAAWPLTDQERQYLMRRFLGKEGRSEVSNKTVQELKRDQIKAHLKELVQRVDKLPTKDLHEDVNAQWVLGRSVGGIESIALALRKTNQVVLIDGTDLTVLTPKRALIRASKVTHTFWQYKNVWQMGFGSDSILRIGIVLNGRRDPGDAYKDAHDFALHQFKYEADLAVDASSADDFRRLAERLGE